MVLKVFVTEANWQDREAASWLVPPLERPFPRLKKVWTDSGYTGAWLEPECLIEVEVVKRSDDSPGFRVVHWRWIVERTFAWLNLFRRLSKDYEYWLRTADDMIYAAMVRLMLKRLAAP